MMMGSWWAGLKVSSLRFNNIKKILNVDVKVMLRVVENNRYRCRFTQFKSDMLRLLRYTLRLVYKGGKPLESSLVIS